MSKNNAKGLTTLRQKLKKYVRDGVDFEVEMAKYREVSHCFEIFKNFDMEGVNKCLKNDEANQ